MCLDERRQLGNEKRQIADIRSYRRQTAADLISCRNSRSGARSYELIAMSRQASSPHELQKPISPEIGWLAQSLANSASLRLNADIAKDDLFLGVFLHGLLSFFVQFLFIGLVLFNRRGSEAFGYARWLFLTAARQK